jgi:uncharacterized damage-inducible protein DinB
MADDKALREQLAHLLAWGDAHVTFDAAVEAIPVKLRGKRPARLPHSIWQLVEHLRIAQYDILDFCINPHYNEMKWPDDYWPTSAAPRSASAWTTSLRQYRRDRRALQALAADPSIELGAAIPHGSGQTYLRELVLVADHGAYHVGQIVLVRRLLGIWSGS